MIELLTRDEWLTVSAFFFGLSVHMRWGSVDFTGRAKGWRWRGWWYR